MIARNLTRGTDLATEVRSADRPWSRMRGLIGSEQLVPGQSLWITPCNGIHMLFMSFPIDVVYLDKRLVVVAVDERMRPWKIGRFVHGAHSVLELPVGAVVSSGTKVGDSIAVE